MADPYSFTEVEERPRPGYSPEVIGAVTASEARVERLEIASQKLELDRAKFAQDSAIDSHKDALSQATGYYSLAANIAKMETETEQKLDAADFLTSVKDLNHNDPDYENKVASLAAKYPLATNDDGVKTILNIKHQARSTYVDTLKKGGAYEFEQDSPAFHKYKDIFDETGDINAARAAADRMDAGEKSVRQLRAGGFVNDDDIFDDVEKGIVKPDLHDEKGFLRYDKIAEIAAKRSGEAMGKPQKAEEAQINRDRDFVTKLVGKTEDLKDTDPALFRLYQSAVQRVSEYDEKKSSGRAPSSASIYNNF